MLIKMKGAGIGDYQVEYATRFGEMQQIHSTLRLPSDDLTLICGEFNNLNDRSVDLYSQKHAGPLVLLNSYGWPVWYASI